MKLLYLIHILTLTVSCTEIENQPVSAENSDSLLFQEFLGLIPDATLPMEIHCGFQCAMDTVDRSRFKRFLPESFSTVVGKINWKPGKFYCVFYAVIGDIPYPYVYTFDYSGNRIDSIYIHNGYCADDEYTETYAHTKISEDMTMFMTDTIRLYWYEKSKTGTERVCDSLIISKGIKKMDSKGHFQVVSVADTVLIEGLRKKK